MKRCVVSLDSRSALGETCAGGKGATLARLRRSGFKVPPGFVITSQAFRRFLSDAGIAEAVPRGSLTRHDLEQTQEIIVAHRIPDRLARSIVRAYRRLDAPPVAVRSSMIGEDADVASFAGQLDTVLNVQGERELLRTVRRCWASMFNWRLLNYLAERGKDSAGGLPDSLAMAVVVQQMVDVKAAGVAFSADPLTGQRCVVVEAGRGLGDAVVQGLVEADRYVVDARGVLAEAIPVNVRSPVLQDEQVLCLSEIVRDVARRAKAPQDVEWAWDGAEFYILQSRPITSLAGKRIYSNKMVSDMSPGLIKPLVYSTKTVAMARNVLGRLFTELIGPNDIDFTSLTARVHSRIYTDVTMLGELFERVGLPANFFEMVSRDERPDARRPPLTPQVLRAILRLFGFAWRHSRVADDIAAFVERHDQELERYRHADWLHQDPQDLLAEFDRLMRLHSECQWSIFIGPINLSVRNRLLDRLVKRWAPDVVPGDLIRGLVGLKALQPNEELQKMAAQVGALGEEVRRMLIEKDDATIRTTLSASEEGRALLHRMDGFMDRYGFLSANGTDFTETPWIENSTLIWRAIGRAAADPMESVTGDVEAIREEAHRRVRDQLDRPRRLFFDRLLASTTTYIGLREQTSLLMSEDSYQMRRIFMALGDQLVARGHLDRRDDIFYLTYDEVRQLVRGELEADAARESVVRSRKEIEADAHIELPDTICGDSVPPHPIVPAENQDCLIGIGGSSGIAEGHASVVLNPADAPVTLTRNHILVVPFTDVGWTPLFAGIGGIVAETGGQLSHTSIVAREYGLPAVVGVKKATLLIKDGQPIMVDGYRGRVYLRRDPEA
jgi:phosphohistidine swiveling domain-containing protein